MRGFRVGIVNPSTPFGSRLRQLLSEQELPTIELKLFETDAPSEATLTQFNDEVVVTQPFDADVLPALDVVFFAGHDSDILNRVASEAAAADVLTIVEGAVGLDADVVAPEPTAAGGVAGRLIVVPRMTSYLVGSVLGKLQDTSGVARAAATVLVPAGVRGDAGAEELHQQVVNLLNFKEPPKDVFRDQIAFNVSIAGPPALASAVAAEASKLAGVAADEASVTVQLVQVPVFHGYAVSLWAELEATTQPKALTAAFRDGPFAIETGRTARSPSPVGIAESSAIHLGPVRADGTNVWVWAVADTTAYDSGRAAIELAKAALG